MQELEWLSLFESFSFSTPLHAVQLANNTVKCFSNGCIALDSTIALAGTLSTFEALVLNWVVILPRSTERYTHLSFANEKLLRVLFQIYHLVLLEVLSYGISLNNYMICCLFIYFTLPIGCMLIRLSSAAGDSGYCLNWHSGNGGFTWNGTPDLLNPPLLMRVFGFFVPFLRALGGCVRTGCVPVLECSLTELRLFAAVWLSASNKADLSDSLNRSPGQLESASYPNIQILGW